jgi:hypothetical protein
MALTPEERQAINDLFDRMRENGSPDKDPEAESLINQLMRRTPDGAYLLVQSVLIQEARIADCEAYMDEQEDRIKQLEAQLRGGDTSSRPRSGGFLGGGAGGSAGRRGSEPSYRDSYQDDRASGMPSIGSRSGPSPYESSRAEPSRAWGGRDEPAMGSRRAAPPEAPPAQGGGGGGFLRTAAAMAAGVAGGALLSNTLGGMFGGGKPGEAQASESKGSDSHGSTDNDPGNYDRHDSHHDDDGGDWGGGGDMDLDI